MLKNFLYIFSILVVFSCIGCSSKMVLDFPDLFISFKNNSGQWQQAVNLGENINTDGTEICPIITNDGNYLFFLSNRAGSSIAYWVSTKFLESYNNKKDENVN